MKNALGPILVATDFSAHARHAAERAARLAHEAHSALALMHVLPGEPLAQIREWLGASSMPEHAMRDEAHRQLRALAADLASARRVQVSTEDAAGAPLDEILRVADRLDAQLLVLGARGMGFLRRLVLGTTSERLMRRTDPGRPRPFKTPLVPLVPILGIIICSGMIISLDNRTQLTAFLWMIFGFAIYFLYSRYHSKLAGE